MDTTDKLLLDPENKESFISGKYVIEFDNFRLNRSRTQEFESAVTLNAFRNIVREVLSTVYGGVKLNSTMPNNISKGLSAGICIDTPLTIKYTNGDYNQQVLINTDIFGPTKGMLTMNQLDTQTISEGYVNFKANRMEKLVDQLELNITF